MVDLLAWCVIVKLANMAEVTREAHATVLTNFSDGLERLALHAEDLFSVVTIDLVVSNLLIVADTASEELFAAGGQNFAFARVM